MGTEYHGLIVHSEQAVTHIYHYGKQVIRKWDEVRRACKEIYVEDPSKRIVQQRTSMRDKAALCKYIFIFRPPWPRWNVFARACGPIITARVRQDLASVPQYGPPYSPSAFNYKPITKRAFHPSSHPRVSPLRWRWNTGLCCAQGLLNLT